MGFLISVISLFFSALVYFLIAGAIMSWFIRPGDRLWPLYLFVMRINEPILAPCRRLMGRFGAGMGVDFSPIVAILLLGMIRSLILRLLYTFA